MAGASQEPVKVVYISTHYVETDQLSFKSVVQNLTGKDSTVAQTKESSFTAQKRRKCGGSDGNDGSGGGGGGVPVLSKGLSIKEFERLLVELPTMEELQWLWSE
ncbi:hypothetical protein U1Q18_009576 [Sarracenia purpurea var. burkii]